MKDVKEEVFGSRKSIITQYFIDNRIDFIKNIWFVTCRYAINPNKKTRYLVLLENDDKINLNIFNEDVPVYRVHFNEKSIDILDIRLNKSQSFSSKETFRDWIIEKTCCKLIQSFASGSSSSTNLSVFFRENMGKGFSLSDVDFFITNKSVFLEEKNFINNNLGYLGEGQLYTFREIQNDICKNIDFNIVLSDKNDFYLVNLSNVSTTRFKILPKWGKMIEYDLGEKLTIDDIIKKYL